MTPQEKISSALQHLASVCDYAASEDKQGFNGADAEFGHDLAEKSKQYPLTPNQLHAALKMLTKYRGQIERAGLSLPDESELPAKTEKNGNGFHAATAPAPATPKSSGAVRLHGKDLKITFPYNPALVEKARELPGRFWNANGKCWEVPLESLDSVQKAFPDFTYDAAISAKLDEARAAAAAEKAEKEKLIAELLARLGDLSAPQADGRVLYAHQREAAVQMVRGQFSILADDMGLGKTRTALTAAKAFQLPVFVVAPVSLRDNWLREAAMVGVQIEIFSWAKIPESPECDFVFIADEAHYAQAGKKSKRGQNFLALADKAKACFCLTGTPIKNGRPINLLPLLQAVRHTLAKDLKGYHKRYCDAKATRWSKWDVTGATNLDELHRKTKNVIIRRMKKDCIDLPDKTRVMRQAEMSDEARRMYDETFSILREEYRAGVAQKKAMAVALAAELKSDDPMYEEKAAQISRLQNCEAADAIVMLNHLRHAGSIAKIEGAVELAQEVLEQNGQVVLFTEFTESAKRIAEALKDFGVELLTGATPNDQRQAMVDRFQAGQSKVFVGTIKAGGVGITLTAAQTVILVDRPWTPGDAVQAEDRCHRIGQKGNVTTIWLQANGTDHAIDQLLEKKYERIELVLAGKRKTLRGSGSIGDVAKELAEALFA